MMGLPFDVIAVVFLVDLTCASDHYNFYPNLPAGEYRIDLKAALRCVQPSNNRMQFNYYVSKMTANTSVLKGNTSLEIPIDDSLDLNVNMAVKDSIGGWKDNAFVYKTPKACTALKSLFGNVWRPFMNGFGVRDVSCPIPAGLYTMTGVDLTMLRKSNFPKQFFYGTYKFRLGYSKNNELYGCFILVLDVKRLWENN